MYGLYGLNHHTVDITGGVTEAGRQTSKDRATQLFCEKLSLAIKEMFPPALLSPSPPVHAIQTLM